MIAVLTACGASYPEPKEAMVQSAAAVQTAEQSGAAEDPRASVYLSSARNEVARAQQLVSDGDNQHAETMLMRARADAELASVLAKTDTEKGQAAKAQAEVDQARSLMRKEK
jgi:hypothetical protein